MTMIENKCFDEIPQIIKTLINCYKERGLEEYHNKTFLQIIQVTIEKIQK